VKPHNDPPRVLYVGRTSFKKGITYILDACDELHREGVRFVLEVVGGIREFVPIHRGYPFAEFTGEVGRDRLPECYQRSDIFVQPAITYETFGLSVAEAMACELPVVVTRMGGMVEVAGDPGAVVEPRNVPEMKDALKRLIEDPTLRADLGRRGRQRMLEHFTWERCVDEYLGLYEQAGARGKDNDQ
jgi:glycosyltransferase involved in cell wall biosynthesis